MKKIFFFMAAMCCALTAYAENQSQLDSIITEYPKSSSAYKTTYTYNSQNLIAEEIGLNTSTSQYTYKYVNSYDENGDKIERIEYNWNTEYHVWASWSKNEYTYLSPGKVSENTRYIWDSEGQWINNGKNIYTYDNHGNIHTNIEQLWYESSWMNSTRETYTYDDNDNMTSMTGESWNQSTAAWEEGYKYEYTYENNLLTRQIFSRWDTKVSPARYVYQNQKECTYDERGNRLTEVYSDWEKSIGAWLTKSKYTYTYDEDNHQLSEVYVRWNAENLEWENQSKTERTYAPEGVELTRMYYIFNSDIQQYELTEKRTYYYSNLGSQCPAPKNLRITNLAPTYALVQWEPSVSGQTDYAIQTVSIPSDYYDYADLNETSYLLENLKPGTTYKVQVEGSCDGHNSDWTEITFTTPWPEALDQVPSDQVPSTKLLRDGQLLIEHNGKTYDARGVEIKK